MNILKFSVRRKNSFDLGYHQNNYLKFAVQSSKKQFFRNHNILKIFNEENYSPCAYFHSPYLL